MIKPEKLKKGDKVAIVSLSSGMLGDPQFIHKYEIGKKRLEEEFGLEVVAMPNALKGSRYLLDHPEARAKDLITAFKDKSIKAIICAIGGEETFRLLPYIDFDVIKQNPKIFTGFSDTTVNHLMCYKAGLVSFYGPCLMCNFAEYGKMFDYEKDAVNNVFFNSDPGYEIKPSKMWSKDFISWDKNNVNLQKKMIPDEHGYEVLQGNGKVRGKLLGGCLESLSAMLGYYDVNWYDDVEIAAQQRAMIDEYQLFPSLEEWKDKILFIETAEGYPRPNVFGDMINLLAKKGILSQVKGIIVGKPKDGKYYEEYKDVLKEVVGKINPKLPIIYNVNFGHASPINIIPYGVRCELDCDKKTITVTENMLVNNLNCEKVKS